MGESPRLRSPPIKITSGQLLSTGRLEPATIDGLVYCSSMVVLYAARHQLRVPGLARWLLGLGIVATLATNLAHGWPQGPIGATVAASLVGSYEPSSGSSAPAAPRSRSAKQMRTTSADQRSS